MTADAEPAGRTSLEEALRDVSSVGVLRADPQGRILYVNEQWCKITGLSQQEILAGRCDALPGDPLRDDRGRWLEAGESIRTETRHCRPDGRELWVQSDVMPEIDAEGRLCGLIATLVDVTTRRRAEEASRHQAQQARAQLEELESIYRHTPVGLCVIDRDLRYVRVNRTFAEIVGRKPEEIPGRTLLEVGSPALRPRSTDLVQRVLDTGEPVLGIELRAGAESPGGERVWMVHCHPLRLDGRITRVLGVLQEVTAQKQAERSANERLRELEALYRNSPVGLAFVDRELRYVRVNEVLARWNGLDSRDHVGRELLELHPRETREVIRGQPLAQPERGGPGAVRVRTRPRSDPDREHVFDARYESVRAPDGSMAGYLLAIHDVTALEAAEARAREQAEQARAQLEELETIYRLAPVGLFVVDEELGVVRMNEALAAIHGRPAAEQIGCPVEDVIPSPEIAAQVMPLLRRVRETRKPIVDAEVRGVLPWERQPPRTWRVDLHPLTRDDGGFRGITGVVRDITLAAVARQSLGDLHAHLSDAQQVARIGSWEWRIIEDRVLWSDEMHRIFGTDPEAFVPSYDTFFERVHPEDRERHRLWVDATLASEEPRWAEFRILRPDGTHPVLRCVALVERTAEGLPARMLGTCQEWDGNAGR